MNDIVVRGRPQSPALGTFWRFRDGKALRIRLMPLVFLEFRLPNDSIFSEEFSLESHLPHRLLGRWLSRLLSPHFRFVVTEGWNKKGVQGETEKLPLEATECPNFDADPFQVAVKVNSSSATNVQQGITWLLQNKTQELSWWYSGERLCLNVEST